MNKDILSDLIDESIRLEMNAAALYEAFHEAHPDDASFWWELHLEEKSHAMLIRAAKLSFFNRGKFPQNLLPDSIDTLRAENEKLEQLTQTCRETPPGRIEAYQIALDVENRAGESHYSAFMQQGSDSPIDLVLQQLSNEDQGHEQRIRERLEDLSS